MPYKGGRGRQFAALPFAEVDGETKVLLITSGETDRWVLPKGWSREGLSGAEVVVKEAFEQGGIRGKVVVQQAGSYRYDRRLSDGMAIDCNVRILLLRVTELLKDWPGRGRCDRRWFTLGQAAAEVEEGELATLLQRLATATDGPFRSRDKCDGCDR